jgi:hypothetical protein
LRKEEEVNLLPLIELKACPAIMVENGRCSASGNFDRPATFYSPVRSFMASFIRRHVVDARYNRELSARGEA